MIFYGNEYDCDICIYFVRMRRFLLVLVKIASSSVVYILFEYTKDTLSFLRHIQANKLFICHNPTDDKF